MSAPALRSVSLQGVHYQVLHDTHYRYAMPASLLRQLAHLQPRECAWQACHERALLIEPGLSRHEDGHDALGNPLSRLAFERPHEALRISTRLQIEVLAHALTQLTVSPARETVAAGLVFSGRALSAAELETCRYRVELPYARIQRRFAELVADCFPPGWPLLVVAAALMEKIFREFVFDAQVTQVATPLDEVLERCCGVYQDFAHLMLVCLHARGLVTRHVSGYPPTRPPPGQARLIGADVSHAWVSLYCPENGWVDFGLANDLLPDLEYITLAWGRDFSDVSPLYGVTLGGGSHDSGVRVTVLPLWETAGRLKDDRLRGGPATRDSRTFSPRSSIASPTSLGDNEAVLRQIHDAVLAFPESVTDAVGPRTGACLSGARGGFRTESDSFLAYGE